MLPNGTMVTVYEQTVVNNKSWGRIKDGWVCMDYVNITGNSFSIREEADIEKIAHAIVEQFLLAQGNFAGC